MSIYNYYSLALNDYNYLQFGRKTDLYNNIAIQSEQVVEKYLKHLVNEFCIDNREAVAALKTHNLNKLYRILLEEGIDLGVERAELSLLKDYYFNARYPGDNFIMVTKEEAIECLELVDYIKDRVEEYLISQGYSTKTGIKK